jgi:hypothetical protein
VGANGGTTAAYEAAAASYNANYSAQISKTIKIVHSLLTSDREKPMRQNYKSFKMPRGRFKKETNTESRRI